ncbi:DUF4062 domain-containing protein [Clostridium perfringens]|uniref:DUF4062 domain-containing protein n=1 Tax=Clostridium perfringens TaxID=1502 RepID=UPI0030CCC9B4
MEKRYQVFISSTFADLQDERKAIMESIMDLDCFPAGMEMFPANDSEQFEYIKTVIDASDYYVLIIAGRYGSLAEDGKSYTEKEFDYAKEKGIPVLVFVKKDLDNIPLNKTDGNEEKLKKLQCFIEKAMKNRLAKYWEDSKELKYEVHSSLSKAFKTHPRIGWVKGNISNNEELLRQINDLRIQNHSLKEKISIYEKMKAESEVVIDKKSLASGKDLYKIKYSYYDLYNNKCHDELALSWDDIGMLVLQIIDRKYVLNTDIKIKFEILLSETYLKDKYREVYGEIIDDDDLEIDISDIQLKIILTQLEVLGLIRKEDGYFKATSKGEAKYIDRLLVKNV